jgi:hypothetical protein
MILILFWFLPFVLGGIFLFPLWGETFGLIAGLLLLMVLILLGDKFFLLPINPKGVRKRDEIANYADNLAFYLGINKARLYLSEKLPHNLYIVDNFFHSPQIIMGAHLEEILSRRELQVLIFYAMHRIKSKEACFRTVTNLLLMVLFFPFLLFRRLNRFGGFFETLSLFTLSPLLLVKNILYKREKTLHNEDRKYLKDYNRRVLFASAIFKINQMDYTDDLAKENFDFFENLSLVEQGDREFFENYFGLNFNPRLRYENLLKDS